MKNERSRGGLTISQNIHRRTKTIIGAGNYDDDGNEGDEGDEGGSSSSGGGSTKSSATCTASSSAAAFSAARSEYIVALAESYDIVCDTERPNQLDAKVLPLPALSCPPIFLPSALIRGSVSNCHPVV